MECLKIGFDILKSVPHGLSLISSCFACINEFVEGMILFMVWLVHVDCHSQDNMALSFMLYGKINHCVCIFYTKTKSITVRGLS